jgi:hypothetical protein
MADVHVLLDGGVEERSVDVELTQFKVECIEVDAVTG